MISVLTPSIREGGLDMVEKCLKRQTFTDFEWLVSTPYDAPEWAKQVGVTPKGDYHYALNRDWNRLYRACQGELIVNIVDLLWFPPDVLERFWQHYVDNPKALVTTIGHQYSTEERGKYEFKVWQDPRARLDQGSFYQVYPNDMEMCLASVPTQAIYDCGGLDEEFDKYSAMSEKEMCYRMDKLGYSFWIDQGIEYRALQHGRIGGEEEWDKHYFLGQDYYQNCLRDIAQGKRLKLNYVSK